jgi:hypothetical protein
MMEERPEGMRDEPVNALGKAVAKCLIGENSEAFLDCELSQLP